MIARSALILTPAALILIAGGCSAFKSQPVATQESTYTAPADNGPAVATTPTTTDPFSVSTGGVMASGWSVSTSEPTNGDSPDTAISLYSTVMGNAMNGGPGGGSARAGGTNFSQVSFSQEGADFDPCVAPDGSFLVFASTQHRSTSDIYVKNISSRVVTQLTNDPSNDVMPRISPEGSRIAFASNRSGNWNIYVMPTTGGKAIQITSGAADDLHPTWSPDGSQLAFCRLGEVSGQWEIWITNVGNSGVAKFLGYGLFPEWCPKAGTGASGADRIAFQKSRERGDRSFGIWTIDYKDGQAGNMTEVASSPIAACINPAWSPDGEWLAFATVPSPSQWAHATSSRPPSADLWMADLNGHTRISLTSGKAVNLMPAWGPDNQLFFVSDRGGNDNLWSMDTGKVVALAKANMAGNSAFAKAAEPAHAPAHPVATVPAADGHSDPH